MSKRLAIVFGGSRGIGAACVKALAEEGYDVAFTYVASKPAPEGAKGSQRIRAYRADICKPEEVAAVFADAARDFGARSHVVVANAGINVPPGPVGQFNRDDFRRLVEVNFVGAFNVLREAAQQVEDGGSIVALTTSLVRPAGPGVGPYSATKAAGESLVRSMSKELAPRKVRVNAVAPGPVDTDLFRAGKSDEAKQRSAAMSPLNRIGDPQEIAQVVCFVASDKASWVDGQVIQPNGGLV